MAKKIPVIELDIIEPRITRKRKLKCEECAMTYTRKHYGILYEVEKLSYFRLKELPKRIVCHQCLYRLAGKLKEGLEVNKVILKINTEKDEIAIRF
jgi:hypothetical protein|tara:strand:- start:1148 stop:1435 length:288 start_codon:yes stop_codon:yes gene_type:complete